MIYKLCLLMAIACSFATARTPVVPNGTLRGVNSINDTNITTNINLTLSKIGDAERSEGKAIANEEFKTVGLSPNIVDSTLPRQEEAVAPRSTCGWAVSVFACRHACYVYGWPYYSYIYATATCCCFWLLTFKNSAKNNVEYEKLLIELFYDE